MLFASGQLRQRANGAVRHKLHEFKGAMGISYCERKEKCSFCKQFLQSPCKIPFRKWSKCVDKAKEENLEFIGACFQYTGALIECTNENHDYFARMSDYSDDEEVEEEQNGASVTEPVAEEKAESRDSSEGHIVENNSEDKKIPM